MFLINFSGILGEHIGEDDGVTRREIEYFKTYFEEHFKTFCKEKGHYGFCEAVKDKKVIKEIDEFYEKNKHFDNVVVLGIGGSALGAKAIKSVVPVLSILKNVYILDNIDPFSLSDFFSSLDFTKTLFLVISKSGETVETLSQFMYCYEKVVSLGLNPKAHFVFITDPEKGFLRKLADEDGFNTFPVPPNLGGRFSVLSFVGLLPAKFMGAHIKDIMSGAAYIDKNCLNEVFSFSLFLYLLNTRKRKSNVVMMPYCDRLGNFALWFSQLWAESLGKKYGINKEILRTGQTPVVSRGVTDQHSQLQLYLEGPKDKVIILLKSKEKKLLAIPNVFSDKTSVSYLCNKTFDELFEAEYLGTYGALMKENVPVFQFEIEKVDYRTLGALFYFFELCTAFSGTLYEINPFNQPAVEIGKKITFGYLGKEGFSAEEFKNRIGELNDKLDCS